MPILTIRNKSFNYPDAGQQPGAGDSSIGYGEDATAWAEEVTYVLESLLAPGDILRTEEQILNNQSSAVPISSLTFSNVETRAANVYYTITRGSLTESGTILLNYNEASSTWDISVSKIGDAEVVFTISGNIIQYTSSNSSAGVIVFTAKTLSR